MKERLKQKPWKDIARYGFGPEAMRQQKICVLCGRAADSADTQCPECGVILPEETLFDTYRSRHTACSRCGTVVSSESEYCPQCGNKLTHHYKGGSEYEKRN